MRYDTITVSKEIAIIGDVHGCHDLLLDVIQKLESNGIRRFVFLGDLVDRGPQPFEVIETVYKLVLEGKASVIMGNHDYKFIRFFEGTKVNMGIDQHDTITAVGNRLDTFKYYYMEILKDRNVFLLDEKNKFILSHAIAMRPSKIHNIITDPTATLKKWFWTGFMYGKSDNVLDTDGYPRRLPITYNVADDLDGWKSIVGHYHTETLYLESGNRNVWCVDFCAGQGGNLAALTFTDDLKPLLVFSDSTL